MRLSKFGYILPLSAGLLMGQAQPAQNTGATGAQAGDTTWTGTLMDANCYATRTQETKAGGDQTTRTTIVCPVTPQTSNFGLMTSGGEFMRFDAPSNTKVLEIVRTDEKLGKGTVKVMGVSQGGVAVVHDITGDAQAVTAQAAQSSTSQSSTSQSSTGQSATAGQSTTAGQTAAGQSQSQGAQATTSTTGTAERAGTLTDLGFDVDHEGDKGKLIVTATGIQWENVNHKDRSDKWTFAQIKEFRKDGRNQIELEPVEGKRYEFDVIGDRDAVYQAIADRIAAARPRP